MKVLLLSSSVIDFSLSDIGVLLLMPRYCSFHVKNQLLLCIRRSLGHAHTHTREVEAGLG